MNLTPGLPILAFTRNWQKEALKIVIPLPEPMEFGTAGLFRGHKDK
jgi:hypothetical protein